MNHAELHETIRSLVDHVATTDPSRDWHSVIHLLDHGQYDEAMDVLVAILVRFNVPITTARRETVRAIMDEFELTDEGRQYYRYLGDREMLDRMTVVDGPAS